MNIAKKIYKTLRTYYPKSEYSNAKLSEMAGAGRSTVSKLAKGKDIGVKVAEFLAKEHGHYDLLREAEVEYKRKQRKARPHEPKKSVRLSRLPEDMQTFVGYIDVN